MKNKVAEFLALSTLMLMASKLFIKVSVGLAATYLAYSDGGMDLVKSIFTMEVFDSWYKGISILALIWVYRRYGEQEVN